MSDTRNKNKKLARRIVMIVAIMIGLSFAAVPLYERFCAATGFDGTTMLAEKAPDPKDIVNREITVLFDARVDAGLPWDFKPDQRKVTVKIGQQGLVSFEATNISGKETVGTAVYNVVPEKMGKYFSKTQCFCFAEQILPPGKTVHMPVMFFIDPKIVADDELDDITDITLSYTFFPANSAALDKAIANFGTTKRQ